MDSFPERRSTSTLDCLKNWSVLCDYDYEIGLHNVVQTVWPYSTVRGCQFHFKQSLW